MWACTMPFPIHHRRSVVRVGVTVMAKVRAGVVFADVLADNASAGLALALVLL